MIQREFKAVKGKTATLPKRATRKSAGYDFVSPDEYLILPKETRIIMTNVKCKMNSDEVLMLFMRSSTGIKKHLMLANGTGIIDADYFENASNDGNIGIPVYNYGETSVMIDAGERIAQGIIMKYSITDEDRKALYDLEDVNDRVGGFGSTGC